MPPPVTNYDRQPEDDDGAEAMTASTCPADRTASTAGGRDWVGSNLFAKE